ncbi:hypothetical protein D3C85_1514960 [compost metagenome]
MSQDLIDRRDLTTLFEALPQGHHVSPVVGLQVQATKQLADRPARSLEVLQGGPCEVVLTLGHVEP